jgi:hypothetical protein
MKMKRVFTNFQVILLIIFLILAIIAINPQPWASGLAIRSIAKNSSASIAGIQSPTADIRPTSRETVLAINNVPMKTLQDYYAFTQALKPNMTFTVKTSKNIYKLTAQPLYNITVTNETVTESYIEQIHDASLNKTFNVTKTRQIPRTIRQVIGVKDIGLNLYPAPVNNLKEGLDLSGGSRIVLQPNQTISQADLDLTIENINQRLNAFGLTDVSVRSASNFEGNQHYIIIEIAGATTEELESLAQQGNFVARIGNDTVFNGGAKDIT